MTAPEPFAALARWLDGQPADDGASVVGWRFDLVAGQGLRVGVRRSRIGGPYEGPGAASRLGGHLELHWSDGRVSRATVDRRGVLDPSSELPAWRAGAAEARGGHLPPLAGPTPLPTVETFDPAVAAALGEDSTASLRRLRHLARAGSDRGARRIDAVARLGAGVRTVATSRGFAATWEETACTIELWVDEIAGVSYGCRALPSSEDLDRLVTDASTLAARLRIAEPLPLEARGVLLMPAVVDELLGRLVLPNLAGRAIRDGRSPFTRHDLEQGRTVVRSDLDLVIDTTLPLELASAPCSSEGVPAGRVALLERGRLVSPLLDLATAPDFGLPPTPGPRGRPVALLSSQAAPLGLDAAMMVLGTGVVVRALPGVHTQQPRRSSYALVVPDAQVVVDGKPGGRCSVRLAGNVLDHLSQPTTRLVHIPGDPTVGLLVHTGAALLPA